MRAIRLATAEEVEKFGKVCDFGPGCTMWALDLQEGVGIAVVRQCFEVDPVILPGDNVGKQRSKVIFQFGLESALTMAGVPQYYFNVPADDTHWQGLVVKTGAEQTSVGPELRFKKVLIPYEHKEGN